MREGGREREREGEEKREKEREGGGKGERKGDCVYTLQSCMFVFVHVTYIGAYT